MCVRTWPGVSCLGNAVKAGDDAVQVAKGGNNILNFFVQCAKVLHYRIELALLNAKTKEASPAVKSREHDLTYEIGILYLRGKSLLNRDLTTITVAGVKLPGHVLMFLAGLGALGVGVLASPLIVVIGSACVAVGAFIAAGVAAVKYIRQFKIVNKTYYAKRYFDKIVKTKGNETLDPDIDILSRASTCYEIGRAHV